MTDHVSASQLGTFAQCGEKFRLQRVEHVPQTPQGAFIGGKAVHKAIEEAELGEWWSDESDEDGEAIMQSFFAAFTKEVAEAGGPDCIRWAGRKTRYEPRGEDEVWWLKTGGPTFLKRYVGLRRDDAALGIVPWGGSPIGATEMAVAAYTPGGTRVEAIVDSFLIDAGEPVIRDWKTGRPGGANPMQAAIYAWAIAQTLGIEVRKAQYVYLRAPDKERGLVAVDLNHLLPLVPAQLDSLVRGIDNEVFLLNPSSFCISCSVNWACEYGRTLPGVSPPPGVAPNSVANMQGTAGVPTSPLVGGDTTSSAPAGVDPGEAAQPVLAQSDEEIRRRHIENPDVVRRAQQAAELAKRGEAFPDPALD